MIAALRLWREGLIGLLLAAIAALSVAKSAADRRAEGMERTAGDAQAALQQTRRDVSAATALAKAEDAARSAQAERDQQTISMEVQNDYTKQLADLRRRYDALRLRPITPAADPGGGGGAAMPRLSEASGGADGAAGEAGLPEADALIASEQALRLKALQDWVRGQEGVER